MTLFLSPAPLYVAHCASIIRRETIAFQLSSRASPSLNRRPYVEQEEAHFGLVLLMRLELDFGLGSIVYDPRPESFQSGHKVCGLADKGPSPNIQLAVVPRVQRVSLAKTLALDLESIAGSKSRIP